MVISRAPQPADRVIAHVSQGLMKQYIEMTLSVKRAAAAKAAGVPGKVPWGALDNLREQLKEANFLVEADTKLQEAVRKHHAPLISQHTPLIIVPMTDQGARVGQELRAGQRALLMRCLRFFHVMTPPYSSTHRSRSGSSLPAASTLWAPTRRHASRSWRWAFWKMPIACSTSRRTRRCVNAVAKGPTVRAPC